MPGLRCAEPGEGSEEYPFSRGTGSSNPVPSTGGSANFRIAPLARPDLIERQPELLAHHLTAAGDIEASPSYIICGARAEVRVCYRARRSRALD